MFDAIFPTKTGIEELDDLREIFEVRKKGGFYHFTQTSIAWKIWFTLPETNSKFAPENRPKRPKRKRTSSNHPFPGANC